MVSVKYRMPVLLVKDISVSKRFYQDLFSLEIENDFGENLAFKASFSLWQKKRAEEIIFNSKEKISGEGLKNVELYFESEDIEHIWTRIQEKSVEIIHELREEPWGQRTLRFLDPDKYIIEIAEPLPCVVVRLYRSGWPASKISDKTQLPLSSVNKIIRDINIKRNKSL